MQEFIENEWFRVVAFWIAIGLPLIWYIYRGHQFRKAHEGLKRGVEQFAERCQGVTIRPRTAADRRRDLESYAAGNMTLEAFLDKWSGWVAPKEPKIMIHPAAKAMAEGFRKMVFDKTTDLEKKHLPWLQHLYAWTPHPSGTEILCGFSPGPGERLQRHVDEVKALPGYKMSTESRQEKILDNEIREWFNQEAKLYGGLSEESLRAKRELIAARARAMDLLRPSWQRRRVPGKFPDYRTMYEPFMDNPDTEQPKPKFKVGDIVYWKFNGKQQVVTRGARWVENQAWEYICAPNEFPGRPYAMWESVLLREHPAQPGHPEPRFKVGEIVRWAHSHHRLRVLKVMWSTDEHIYDLEAFEDSDSFKKGEAVMLLEQYLAPFRHLAHPAGPCIRCGILDPNECQCDFE